MGHSLSQTLPTDFKLPLVPPLDHLCVHFVTSGQQSPGDVGQAGGSMDALRHTVEGLLDDGGRFLRTDPRAALLQHCHRQGGRLLYTALQFFLPKVLDRIRFLPGQWLSLSNKLQGLRFCEEGEKKECGEQHGKKGIKVVQCL